MGNVVGKDFADIKSKVYSFCPPEPPGLTKAERKEGQTVLAQLRRDARVLVAYFRLQVTSVDAERAQVKSRYGVCYSDGSIRIRLRHARTGRLLKYSGLVDTLCHELAHLRFFDHGVRFQIFYRRILEHARHIGIYRPGPRPRSAETPVRVPLETRSRARAGPLQLELFSSDPG